MKLIKFAIISIISIFIIVTAIGLLLPSTVLVSRTIETTSSADSVFKYTKDLMGWKQWAAALQNVSIYSPHETQIGKSILKINSKNNRLIAGEWIEENGKTQQIKLQIIERERITIINWQFQQKVSWFPIDRFGSIVNEKVIGKMMEDNLAELKNLLEKSE